MSRRDEVRFVLVTQKTRLQELIARFNTWPQAKFYLEHNGISVSDYLAEHDRYQAQLTEAKRILLQAGQVQIPDRTLLPGYQFSDRDIVVIIGRDGLVANTLKYLNGQPVIAVNPDPERWDGILLPFELPQLASVVMRTLNLDMPSKVLSFAQAVTNDGQKMLAVNDLFIGPKSHTSARYILSHGGQAEAQSSSGVIVSTGLGSTGWLQSVLAGALGAGTDQRPDLLGNTALTADDLTHVVGGDTQLQRQLLIALDLRNRDGVGIFHQVSGDVEQQVFHAVPSNWFHYRTSTFFSRARTVSVG